MIRQYGAQRCRGGDNPLRVGVIAVGSIFYLQDDEWWWNRYRGAAICRDPWIVEAFLNGTVGAARHNRETGMWEDVYFSGRSDTAALRSLRHGHRDVVPVHTLILHEEKDLVRQPCAYPTLPALNLWHVQHRRPSQTPARESSGLRPPPEDLGPPRRVAESTSPPCRPTQAMSRQAHPTHRRGRSTAPSGYHGDRPTVGASTSSSET